MADMSGTVSVAGLTDWVYDPHSDEIHVVTSTGMLHTWDVSRQSFASTLQIGGSPIAVDVSPDGPVLLVANKDQVETSDPFALEKIYADVLTEVDLLAGTVRGRQFAPRPGEGGIGDVAFGADGKALLTTYYQGFGRTPLREYDPATASFDEITGVGRSNTLDATTLRSGHLIMSEDRRYAFIQEDKNGELHVWDTVMDYRVGSARGDGTQTGLGDMSTAASLVVFVNGMASIYDLAMNWLGSLSYIADLDRVVGAEFNEGGRQLFVWQVDKVAVLDTATWAQIGSLDVASPVPSEWIGQTVGGMDVMRSGRLLGLDLGDRLELIDLSVHLKLTITGGAGPDKLFGSIGLDTISGGAGNDTIDAGVTGDNVLTGDDGNDSIVGGADFDAINGNKGEDTASGRHGDDWVLGGQGSDLLFGDEGDDLVYGNIGNDTVHGGTGADSVRGGQDDDRVHGGDGDDWLSGDRGSDAMWGGAGADTFHIFEGAGADIAYDFSVAEGDRVQLLPGETFTADQVGADVIVNLGQGDYLVLYRVQLSTLQPGWIFGT